MEQQQQTNEVVEVGNVEIPKEFEEQQKEFEGAQMLFSQDDLPAKKELAEGVYSYAPDWVSNILNDLIKNRHTQLSNARFLILFRETRWTSKGKAVKAQTKQLEASLRTAFNTDYRMIINKEVFLSSQPRIQEAIIDSELCSCDINPNNTTGEFTYKIITPDIQCFSKNIEYYGFWHEDLQAAKHSFDQQNIFETKEDDNEETE